MSHAQAKPAPGGPPPFEPSVQSLTALTSAAQGAIGEYETASTPAAKATALRKLQQASTKLTIASTPPQQQYLELALRPHLNGALRIAIEMGAFNALPQDGTAIALDDIAKKMNAEEDFVLRIMRVLVAYNLVAESDAASSPAYSHSALSRFMCNPMAQAGYKHLFHTMLPGGLNAYPGYFQQNGFQNPPSSKNAPITFAEGKKDMTIFDILEQDPTRLDFFHTSMAMVNAMSSGEAAKTYPFDKLEPNSDGIVYVDVGGGKGQTVKMVKDVYPHLKGKVVVEDLPEVVSEGLMLPESEMIAQPYNFLEEEQPVKGAPAYFLKWIFHDWPDSACQTILRNLAPAMRVNPDSRLLICDRILPERGVGPAQALSDMNMLVIGGKERSVSQFQRILESEGYKIVKIWGEGNAMNGIVEAMLA